MKKHIISFDNFSLNEGIFDIFRSKKETSPRFGYSTDNSKDSYLKSATHSQINLTYQTSWDASFVVDISGDLVTQGKDSYVITPRKIRVYPTYSGSVYGGTANSKPIDFSSYKNSFLYGKSSSSTEEYLKKSVFWTEDHPRFHGVDSLYDNFNRTMQSYIGKDLMLSFYELDLEAWVEEHTDPDFIIGRKTPSWVKNGVKLPLIEGGELPETNLLDNYNRLKEPIWVSIPEMGYALARPGNGILREISVYSTEMW
jgi:hypothetical protein